MTSKDIALTRLYSQQVAGASFTSPGKLVSWMGAMQAQDFAMSRWALGIRLPGITESAIDASLDKGEVLRTHILRPTWHLVSADDIYWILELSAPQIRALSKARHKELELDETVFSKTNKLIEKALTGNKHLTREELAGILGKAKIEASNDRGSHIMFRAELEGIVCSGSNKNNKQTYALLPERVPKKKSISREEALAKLARLYFTSHCPATLQDFTWWSGLSITDARAGLETIKKELNEETIGDDTYWLPDSFSFPKKDKTIFHFLPAFDELVISYRNRTAILDLEEQKTAFTANGIFKPVITENGKGIGLWKRTLKKDTVIIETSFFEKAKIPALKNIEQAVSNVGAFLNKKVEIVKK